MTTYNLSSLNPSQIRQKKIKLSKINISPEMLSSMPRTSRLRDKYARYRSESQNRSNDHSHEILIDKDNMLLDGYITFLLARAFNEKKIIVSQLI